MASADTLLDHGHGRGGHASEPHRALDPIPVACEIVQALQTDGHPRDRRVRPGGRHRRADHRRHDEQHHPRDGRDRGHDPRRQRAHPRARCTTASAASPRASPPRTGATVDGRDRRRLPGDRQRRRRSPTFALGVAAEVVGADKVVRLPHPVMGAEDFSYVLQRVPGAMMFLGGTPPDRDPATAAPNHSNRVLLRRGGDGRRHRRCTPRDARCVTCGRRLTSVS